MSAEKVTEEIIETKFGQLIIRKYPGGLTKFVCEKHFDVKRIGYEWEGLKDIDNNKVNG